MNLLTINNENLIGYNVYNFLKYYKKAGEYEIDENKKGYLFLYEHYFPFQMFNEMFKDKNKIESLKNKVDNFYLLSKDNLEKIEKIFFFYPFTYYSKHDYDFPIISLLKEMIENKFKKECQFVLNNYFMDDNYRHFSIYRYDIFNDAREIKKQKSTDKKEKIFISLNAKERKHRDDLYDFINENNLLNDFYFSYTKKNIDWGKISTFSLLNGSMSTTIFSISYPTIPLFIIYSNISNKAKSKSFR